ncbi:sporadic carbohydrate cluster protein, LIC12192 family [Alphaproteobacteria bacterium]|nr:sporadic carbohydrate cluster protein, LIC12192 family [Alphaproteobacteria bacterium]
MKKFRGYIFSRDFLGERAPQHVQNIVIRDYCSKKNIQFLLSSVEYAMPNSSIIFQQLLNELKVIDGIVAYSMFQLPDSDKIREKTYQKVLKDKKEIHFAVENLSIKKSDDIIKIENILKTKKYIKHSLKKI